MKTSTLFIVAFLVTIFFTEQAKAQMSMGEIYLSQSTTQILLPNGGISCPGGDNQWYREYILNEEGINTSVAIVGMEFGVQAIDATAELEIFAYEYEDFPIDFDVTNLPAPIASGTITIGSSDVGNIVRANFDSPVVVAANTSVVVSLAQPMDGVNLFIGITEGETKSSYASSIACGTLIPTTPEDWGFPELRHLLNLVVTDVLSVNDYLAQKIIVYPNPLQNTLKLDIPSTIEVQEATLYNLLGKDTGSVLIAGEMDTSNLSTGVYILSLKTTAGTLTKKVVKQ